MTPTMPLLCSRGSKMSQLLGSALSRIIPSTGGLTAVVFPRGIGPALPAALVHHANAKFGSKKVPFSVRVSGSGDRVSGDVVVSPHEVVSYRVGRRLFVWEEGDFDPDKSFSTSVGTLIGSSFPDVQSRDPRFHDLAAALVAVVLEESRRALADGSRRDLEAS